MIASCLIRSGECMFMTKTFGRLNIEYLFEIIINRNKTTQCKIGTYNYKVNKNFFQNEQDSNPLNHRYEILSDNTYLQCINLGLFLIFGVGDK